MAIPEAELRLTAVLLADSVGYPVAARRDHDFIIEAASRDRKFLIDCVNQHAGQVIKTVDQIVLAEFASVLDAVTCGTDAQRLLAARNGSLSKKHRARFRIGIDLGTARPENDGVLSDSVSNAARLAAIAEPGGLCISRTAYDEVKPWLKLPFESRKDWTTLMSIPRHLFHPPPISLLEVSAVKINLGAITGRSDNVFDGWLAIIQDTGIYRKIKHLLEKAFLFS